MSTPPRHPSHSGAFPASQALRAVLEGAPTPAVSEFTLQDINEIRLLLSGESVVDWYRLDLRDESDVRRLLALNGLDASDRNDIDRIATVRGQAVRYVRETLKLRIPEHLASEVSFFELALLASSEGRDRPYACLLLKAMHIIYHLDARELRTQLPIADNELFGLVEESVVRMFDELRGSGVPVVEFSWSRKTRSSLITKMLVKRATSAARVFDRLRFRLIVEDERDLESTLHVMLHRCIPFNYIVPGESVNALPSLRRFAEEVEGPSRCRPAAKPKPMERNEFSGDTFQVLNFIADLPVRVDELDAAAEFVGRDRGRVVFVLAEFQILDRATAARNEEGEARHEAYKTRQHTRVKDRLMYVPNHAHGNGNGNGDK